MQPRPRVWPKQPRFRGLHLSDAEIARQVGEVSQAIGPEAKKRQEVIRQRASADEAYRNSPEYLADMRNAGQERGRIISEEVGKLRVSRDAPGRDQERPSDTPSEGPPLSKSDQLRAAPVAQFDRELEEAASGNVDRSVFASVGTKRIGH